MARRKRYPKGTWMKLKSREILIAFMEKENFSVSRLAQYAGCSRAMIGHLRSGYKSSCSPELAERIAEALGVPDIALFDLRTPTNSGRSGDQRKKVA